MTITKTYFCISPCLFATCSTDFAQRALLSLISSIEYIHTQTIIANKELLPEIAFTAFFSCLILLTKLNNGIYP